MTSKESKERPDGKTDLVTKISLMLILHLRRHCKCNIVLCDNEYTMLTAWVIRKMPANWKETQATVNFMCDFFVEQLNQFLWTISAELADQTERFNVWYVRDVKSAFTAQTVNKVLTVFCFDKLLN